MGFSDVLKRLLIGKATQEKVESPFLTRQELNDSIVEKFKAEMENETTKTGLLFPTCFYIYLNDTDFVRRQQAFRNTVREVVMCFNDIISHAKQKYPDFIPHSTRWTFQFGSFKPGTIIDLPGQRISELPMKSVFILSSIYSEGYTDVNETPERMVMTMHDIKSSVLSQPIEVNSAAFRDITTEARDRFVVEMGSFSTKKEPRFASEETTAPIASANTGVDIDRNKDNVVVKQIENFAKLRADNTTFVGSRGPSQSFNMTEELIYVCGRNSMNRLNGAPVAKVNNENVLTPHLTIKSLGENEFYIAATGDVRLNEVLLPHDSNKWTRLPNNSSILLNDEIQITFKINKK